MAGEPALRDAIAAKYRAEQGADFARENVVVTAGAKQAVFNACQVLFGEGDEVALFSPYWVSFPEIVRLAGAEPLFVATELGGELARSAASGSRAGRRTATRGVILNSPEQSDRRRGHARGDRASCSPGARSSDAWLIFDETYDRFLYDGRPHVSAAAFPEHRDRVIVTGAASKT